MVIFVERSEIICEDKEDALEEVRKSLNLELFGGPRITKILRFFLC